VAAPLPGLAQALGTMENSRAYCNSCKSNVWHDVVADHSHARYVELWGYEQKEDAQILKCRGCDAFTFRHVEHPFEFQDPQDKPEEFFYPDRNHKKRERKFFPAPRSIWQLYTQVVEAQDRKLTLLSAAGLRSLIEAIVADKIEKSKYTNSIQSKIQALEPYFEPGVIAVLHDFRIMGNAALHAQQESHHLDIHRALYVIEGILEYFYGIKDSADAFASMKEARVKKATKRVRNKAGA
jgi:hypothetical protein